MTDAQKLNVLIAGSREVLGDYAQGTLAGPAFRLIGAIGGEEACAAVRSAGVDVALVDLSSFAFRDGLSVARRLRIEAPDVPLVLVTGEGNADTVEAIRLGAIDVLHRPFSSGEVSEAVSRAVCWRRDTQRADQTSDRHSCEMADRAAMLVQSCADAHIVSAAGLGRWLATVYRADAWTSAHVRRVTDLAVSIAATMGIDEPLIGWIERAALLHDVGKLAVPPEILRKPGPLTAAERDLARGHVAIASDVSSVSAFLRPSADIVAATRERFDGSGYPRRLRGSDIPVGAAIIAVAEGVDTIASARSVGEPLSADAANAAIVRGAGSRFDPVVVRAWLQCLDRGTVREVFDEGGAA